MPRATIFRGSRSRRSAIRSRRWGSAPITASRCCRASRPATSCAACPAIDDEQARYIEASFGTAGDGGEVRVASAYIPNGNPSGTDKFTYKLAWMERLVDHAQRPAAP